MATQPERLEESKKWREQYAKRVSSSQSQMVKRLKHIDWHDESE